MTGPEIFLQPHGRGRITRRAVLLLLFMVLAAGAAAVENVSVAGLFKDRAIVMVDGVQRVLTPGQRSPEGITLISANSAETILEINGDRNTFKLGDHITTRFSAPAAGKTVTIAPDRLGMYQVNGSINGFQVTFIVDTGATHISMNKHQARRLGLDYKMLGATATSVTASGPVKIYMLKLDKVAVGDIELQDIQGAVHDGDFPEVILLGSSFLSRVDMQRDGQLMRLEQKY
jgi:aspartyl protease family protein